MTKALSPRAQHFRGSKAPRRLRTRHSVSAISITTPTEVANLSAWYDFSDISTLFQDIGRTSAITADAQTIKGVTDKGSVGTRHLTEPTNGPLYKESIQNGKSVARFDGTNDILSAASYAANPPTWFVVASVIGGGADNGRLLGNGSMSLYQAGATSPVRIHPTDDAGATTGLGDAGFGVFAIFALRWRTTDVADCWMNGVPGTQGGVFNPNGSAHTATALQIGKSPDSSEFANCDIGEVLIYNASLGSDYVNAVGNYLATKWGLTWQTVP